MEFRRVLFRSEQEALFLALGFFLLFARNTEDAIGNADVDVLLRKTRKFGSQAVRLFIIHHVQRGDGGETTLAKIEDTPRGTTEIIEEPVDFRAKPAQRLAQWPIEDGRSEEHTSKLQSLMRI